MEGESAIAFLLTTRPQTAKLNRHVEKLTVLSGKMEASSIQLYEYISMQLMQAQAGRISHGHVHLFLEDLVVESMQLSTE